MITATLRQWIPARMMVLLVLLLAAATVATILIAAFHGTPVHGTGAMSYGGKPGMSYG